MNLDKNKQQNNRKKNYKKNRFICAEYVVMKDNDIVADFKTAQEAIKYKEENPNTTIYILKTFKFE